MLTAGHRDTRAKVKEKSLPDAAQITVKETLDLIDGPLSRVGEGVTQGLYALWLGSGISRDRVVGVDGVLARLLEFLRGQVTSDPDCGYREALMKIITMAAPSDEEFDQIDLLQPAASWSCLPNLLKRLWKQYSAVLSVEISGEPLDYLLWVGLDFINTFSNQQADAEHLAIGMLALEGTVTHLASANWDGLLEAAIKELGYPESFYQITVTGNDLRNRPAAATLYKFHGCALRAIANEDEYRKLLVARSAQITSWKTDDAFKIVRDQLGALIQKSRTLMIGMSAQDENIRHLFGSMNAHKGWDWTDEPTPVVFSAQELGDDHKDLLIVTYGQAAYEANREAISRAARIQAYAKPLLLALLLHTLTTKLRVLVSDVQAPNLDAAAHSAIADGLRHLRDRVAEAGDTDRLALAKRIACNLARARHQLQNGDSPAGVLPYFPIDTDPAHRMKGKLALQSTGQREAAAALGLIGLDERASAWETAVDDPTDARAGALRLSSRNGSARVFLAAHDETITHLMDCGAFDETDGDVVVICSGSVSDRQQRSPSRGLRDGTIGPRFVQVGSMLAEAATLDDLRERFRGEIAL